MTTPDQRPINNMKAVLSTIEQDNQVYRWFLSLVATPAIKSQLQKEKKSSEAYSTLKETTVKQQVIYIVFLCLILFVISFSKYMPLWSSIILLYFHAKLISKKKQCVIQISRNLLTRDFNESQIAYKTFYQISEFYSRKYSIPSFVDAVTTSNNISFTIAITFVFMLIVLIFFTFPLGTCISFLVLLRFIHLRHQ